MDASSSLFIRSFHNQFFSSLQTPKIERKQPVVEEPVQETFSTPQGLYDISDKVSRIWLEDFKID